MSERGVFAVDRGIFDHPTLSGEKYTKVQAFMWIVAEAAWKPHRRAVGAAVVDLKRGQAACSLRFMAGKWGWEEPRVRRFLARLKTDAMIDAATDAGVTVITVCNYDIYQRVSLPADAPRDAVSDAAATQQRRKGEDREDKETTSLRSVPAKPAKVRGRPKTQIEESTQPDERQRRDAAAANLHGEAFRLQWQRFRDHHLKVGSLFSDWQAAWRTWLNSPIRLAEIANAARASPGPKATASSWLTAAADANRDLVEAVDDEFPFHGDAGPLFGSGGYANGHARPTPQQSFGGDRRLPPPRPAGPPRPH